MSHYDYFSPGLAGPVEDLMAVGVKTVAKSVGSSSNRDQAWDYFRFNKTGLAQGEKDLRIAEWRDLSTPFKVAMDGLKGFHFPLAAFTDLKDFKLQDRLQVQADLKKKFDDAWAKAFPASAQAPASPATSSPQLSRTGLVIDPRVSLLAARPLVPASAGPSSTGGGSSGGEDDKKSSFPVVPVAIGAAVLAVILLMRKG